MQRVAYNECLHNHAANLGRYMVDGCHEYSPKIISADLLCAACGCHRNYHRKVTIFDPDNTEASGNHSPGDHNLITPKEESFDHEAVPPMIGTGGEDERLNQLVDPAQHEKKKRPKSRFTKEQVEQMRAFAENLGWSTRDRSRVPEIMVFCASMGITKVVFTTWLYNNKKHYGRGSSSKKNSSSTRDGI
ncbi:zinc-finger homeodomain protein 10 [Eucalyptus grandis]|nr:zinc-finger homeodomain protein 10 [Eucalyptus grandis]